MAVLIPGLVSVTFRKLPPREIISLCIENSLSGIEWGGDIHVPVGDITHAKLVKQMTVESGLSVSAYGSYFKLGQSIDKFKILLETARALGAPTIRIWAGTKSSSSTPAEERTSLMDQLNQILNLAGDVTLSLEMHLGTLNDTVDSSLQILDDCPQVFTYWQPLAGNSVDDNIAFITAIRDRITNLHVFNWGESERLFLEEARDAWIAYLKKLPNKHYISLEFVPGDAPENLAREARALLAILRAATAT